MGCLLPAVARIALVKPDKARGVENLAIQMAQRGQITENVSYIFMPMPCLDRRCPHDADLHAYNTGTQIAAAAGSFSIALLLLQVSEEKLIGLLEQINTQASSRSQTKVTIQRRRTAWDDDDN
jgi:programmed cell death protein 5